MPTLTHDDIVHMTLPERLALFGELWDSIVDHDLGTTLAQRQELERRMSGFSQDVNQAVTWDDLRAKLSARHW